MQLDILLCILEGLFLDCPKAIHIIPSAPAQLLCPNSVPGVPKTTPLLFGLSPVYASSCAPLPCLGALQMEVPPPIPTNAMELTVPSGPRCDLKSPVSEGG